MNDIDVIMELISCVCILKLNLSDYIWNLSIHEIRNSHSKDGYFYYLQDKSDLNRIDDYFSRVYHTTLVACILKRVLLYRPDLIPRFELSDDNEVEVHKTLRLLKKLNSASIDLLYSQITSNNVKHRETIHKLSRYSKIFATLCLFAIFYEEFEKAQKLIAIYEHISKEDATFLHQRLDECR